MLNLKSKTRKIFGKKTKELREKGIAPAILYGPKIENIPLEVNLKDFYDVYKEAGESSLISLEVSDLKDKKFSVLIHKINRDPLSDKIIHIDFYQPVLTEETEVLVPLVFEGESPAVKDLGGTLVKEIQEIEVRALPQNLPHEIKADISNLKTFDDELLVRDLQIPENVKINREPDEIVAVVVSPEKEEVAEAPEETAEETEEKESPPEEKGSEDEEK
ncbi:MAG TPA: 50S ribosomal protein L25 [Candidatus Parcubacteria bacterium]|nr:50S ribosomal protein L25 [Candidatus Parcubacteria bacterium]